MNKTIIISGMHRSGTSALAGLLNIVGVELGKNLMPGIPGENDKGFWELRKISDTNELLLNSLGYTWDDIRVFSKGMNKNEKQQNYKNEIIKTIKSEINVSSLWAVKDPRICRLLPFWKDILNEQKSEYFFVWALRHPWEVAHSLRKRNGFSFEKSGILWMDYNFSFIHGLKDEKLIQIKYENLLNNPIAVLEKISADAEIQWPKDINMIETEIHSFIDKDMRHHKWVPNTYDLEFGRVASLIERAFEHFNKFDSSEKTKWYIETEKLYGEYKRMVTENYDCLLLEQLEDLTTRYYDEKDDRVKSVQWALALDKELKALAHEKEMLDEKVDRLAHEKETLNDEIERFVHEKELLSKEKEVLRDEINSFKQKIKNYDETSNKQKQMIRDFRINIRDYEKSLKDFEEKERIFNESKLGRLVRWVRYFIGPSYRIGRLVRLSIYKLLSEYRIFRSILPYYLKKLNRQKGIDNVHLEKIKIMPSENPLVSIIIPVYSKLEFTLQCLQSVIRNTEAGIYEIIVVDDCPADKTSMILSNIDHLIYVKNNKNFGFTVSCNVGSEYARGKYLLFLNNDTKVTSGWFKAMHRTFELFDNVGLVGAKLIYPEGRLQEAGGIVWRDGSAWNYGKEENPQQPEYDYAREVDYCSGACLMIKKSVFEEVDRFDELFSPAYYEDTDLSFKVRKTGRKVIYQPKAEVIHFEGISCGTETDSGIKKYQEENKKKFYEKWKGVLRNHCENGRLPILEKDRYCSGRLLFVDSRVIRPDHDAGSLRQFNMFKILLKLGYKITYLVDNHLRVEGYTDMLQEMGIECQYAPFLRSVFHYIDINGHYYDMIWITRAEVAKRYLNYCRNKLPKSKIIFDTVDLHFLRGERRALIEKNKKLMEEAYDFKKVELSASKKSDVTIVVSSVEKDILRNELPDTAVEILSLIHPVYKRHTNFKDRKHILFIGGFEHPPNVDAVRYFILEIFPMIRERIKGIKFYIIGSNAPKSIRLLAKEDIIILGYVEDIKEYFNSCRLSISPLRYGAGVKGKINTSMSYGLPVVATSISCEGMDLVNGKNVLIANDEKEFTEAVVRLYNDEALWYKLSEAGTDNIKEKFSFEVAEKTLKRLLA